mmetsp:Transcript_104857/g.271609  ORF Transcript_104857/g.271609 Transcript_104857/m.271609 type:complete len:278 (-) Transcript_104857:560-1393(-)
MRAGPTLRSHRCHKSPLRSRRASARRQRPCPPREPAPRCRRATTRRGPGGRRKWGRRGGSHEEIQTCHRCRRCRRLAALPWSSGRLSLRSRRRRRCWRWPPAKQRPARRRSSLWCCTPRCPHRCPSPPPPPPPPPRPRPRPPPRRGSGPPSGTLGRGRPPVPRVRPTRSGGRPRSSPSPSPLASPLRVRPPRLPCSLTLLSAPRRRGRPSPSVRGFGSARRRHRPARSPPAAARRRTPRAESTWHSNRCRRAPSRCPPAAVAADRLRPRPRPRPRPR